MRNVSFGQVFILILLTLFLFGDSRLLKQKIVDIYKNLNIKNNNKRN